MLMLYTIGMFLGYRGGSYGVKVEGDGLREARRAAGEKGWACREKMLMGWDKANSRQGKMGRHGSFARTF